MTIEICLSICRNDGFPYAGLEWQIECFCGHESDSGFIWSWPNKCNERCAGDSFQNCGGSNAISISFSYNGVLMQNVRIFVKRGSSPYFQKRSKPLGYFL